MRIHLFFLDHALAHTTQTGFGTLLIQLHYFIDQRSVFLESQFGVIIDFDSDFTGSFDNFLFAVELFQERMFEYVMH